jgi:TatD DNase family protein
VHCFTGTEAELKKYVEMGLYIGITGWICDGPRGGSLRAAVPFIPLERLMIETDAPFLAPKNIRPRPDHNEPYYLGRVAESVALCLGLPVSKVIEHSTQNALRFFSLLKK